MFALALFACLFSASIYGAIGRPAVSYEFKEVVGAAQSYYLPIPPILLPSNAQLQLNYSYTAVTVPPPATVPQQVSAPVPVPTVSPAGFPTTAASFRLPLPNVTMPSAPIPTTAPPTTRPLTTATVNVASATQSVNCLGLACYTLLPLVPYSYAYSEPLPLSYYWGWRGGWQRCYWLFC